MASLTRDQAELLKAFAEAYQVPSVRNQQKEALMFYTASQVGTQVQHQGLPGGVVSATMGDLEDFADYGLIRIRYGKSDHQGTFTVTPEGYQAVEQIEKQERILSGTAVAPPDGAPTGLDWNTQALPVLKAVTELFSSHPVSQDSINEALGREPGNDQTDLVLRKLEEADFFTGTIHTDQKQGPVACEPGPKALELLAGWPTERADAALQQLIAVLEKKIEETADEEEKSKLRRALTSIQDVGERVMTGVIADVIKSKL